jgi:hypothetical protein
VKGDADSSLRLVVRANIIMIHPRRKEIIRQTIPQQRTFEIARFSIGGLQ